MTENEIAQVAVDVALKIHTTAGPGLLESAYQAIMAWELQKRGLRVVCEKPIPLVYETVHLDAGFRGDLPIEDKVIIELKSIEAVAPVHKKQLLTYLRISGKHLGRLINFGGDRLRDGITRIVNNL
jgi:GxxExxY protein